MFLLHFFLQIFWKKVIFPDFSRFAFLRIWLDWRALVELRIPNIEKQRGFFLLKKKYFLKISDFLRYWIFIFFFFYNFWHFLDLGFFYGFFFAFFFGFFIDFFLLDILDFLFGFFGFFFLFFLIFLIFFGHFRFFFGFFRFFSKLLRLLNNLWEVTTEHQKWLKIGTNRIKTLFLPWPKPWPKPSAGARSKPTYVVRIEDFV